MTQPVLSRNEEGRLTLKVRFDRMTGKTEEAEQALYELYQALDKNKFSFLLNPNALYIADNRRVVHGRKAFTATFDENDRHLKRIFGMRAA